MWRVNVSMAQAATSCNVIFSHLLFVEYKFCVRDVVLPRFVRVFTYVSVDILTNDHVQSRYCIVQAK